MPFLFLPRISIGQAIPADHVSVYLVPMDGFPENLADSIAMSLQKSLGIGVKASVSLPPLDIDTLPGTTQLDCEELLMKAAQASSRLPAASRNTYRIFLTMTDINSPSGNFRFLFSFNNTTLRCSVVSFARMLEYPTEHAGQPIITERSALRLLKMVKRGIGLLYLGWNRSADPNDVMYSPLMSLEDLDRMGLEHKEHPKHHPSKSPPQAATMDT